MSAFQAVMTAPARRNYAQLRHATRADRARLLSRSGIPVACWEIAPGFPARPKRKCKNYAASCTPLSFVRCHVYLSMYLLFTYTFIYIYIYIYIYNMCLMYKLISCSLFLKYLFTKAAGKILIDETVSVTFGNLEP